MLTTATWQRRSSRILCLLANETVAEDYYWQEIPFLYRVHETPDDDKMKKLATFLQNFGYTMHIAGRTGDPSKGSPEASG